MCMWYALSGWGCLSKGVRSLEPPRVRACVCYTSYSNSHSAKLCDAETISTLSGTTYYWPETFVGEAAIFTCPLSSGFEVTRNCSLGGVWQSFSEEACGVVNEHLNRLNGLFTNVRNYKLNFQE